MRVALAVNLVTDDVEANVAFMLKQAEKAADAGAELVLFPEGAPTGLINNDQPEHDLPLGTPVPGPLTDRFAAVARERDLWIGLGLFEREGNRLYDTAVLLNPDGEVALKYRRIHPGWHAPNADPSAYGEGDAVPLVATPFGTMAFLICGDLFHDDILALVPRPDFLLYPFARGVLEGSLEAEIPEYAEQVRQVGVTALMTNYLSAPGLEEYPYPGGAWVVRPDGTVSHSLPTGQAGLLVADL